MARNTCRYCKSPAPGRPCWWFDDHPQLSQSGGDPPCSQVYYDVEEPQPIVAPLAVAIGIILLTALVVVGTYHLWSVGT